MASRTFILSPNRLSSAAETGWLEPKYGKILLPFHQVRFPCLELNQSYCALAEALKSGFFLNVAPGDMSLSLEWK
jgi:hypothetical protein